MDDIDVVNLLSSQSNLIDNVETYIVPFELSGLDRDYKVSRYRARVLGWIRDWNRIRVTFPNLLSNIEIDEKNDIILPAIESLLRYRRYSDYNQEALNTINSLEELELNDQTLHLFQLSEQYAYQTKNSIKNNDYNYLSSKGILSAKSDSLMSKGSSNLSSRYIIQRISDIQYFDRKISKYMKTEIIREIRDEMKTMRMSSDSASLVNSLDTNAGFFALSDVLNNDSLVSSIQATFDFLINTDWLSNPRILDLMLRLSIDYNEDSDMIHYMVYHSKKLWDGLMNDAKAFQSKSILQLVDYPLLNYKYYESREFSYLSLYAALYHSSKLLANGLAVSSKGISLMSKRYILLKMLKVFLANHKTHMYDLILRIGAIEYEPYEIMLEESPHLERYRKHKHEAKDYTADGSKWPFQSFILDGITNFKDDLYHDPVVTLETLFSKDSKLEDWPLIGLNEADSLINFLDINRTYYEQLFI